MKFNRKDAGLIESLIEEWVRRGEINEATAERLRSTYQIKEEGKTGFDWKNLSLIAFFFSMICIVLATVMFLADKWLMAFFDALIDASDSLKMVFFALLSGFLYYWAFNRKKKQPGKIYSNEALFMLGAVSVAFTLTYLGFLLHLEEGAFSLLILLAALIFGAVGIFLHSSLSWYLTLAALAVWFGTETGYRSGWKTHFLGMNYPLRYVFFGIMLLLLSFLFRRFSQSGKFVNSTFATGLAALLFSFWLLSIFGNHGDWEAWSEVSQFRFIYWAVILTLACMGAIYYGLKKGDRISREIGIVFLLLNLYTRYFEYFWDSLHKVLFFSILAASFWLIGKKAENIWQVGEKDIR